MQRASNLSYVIACHKLLELMGTIGMTIVTLQLIGDSMCGEVSLKGSGHFFASLLLKLVDFKVAGIIIYCAKVVCFQTGRYCIQLFSIDVLEFCDRLVVPSADVSGK